MAVNNIADPEANVPTKPKGGRKKILLVLVIVLVLAAGAAAVKFLLFTTPDSPEEATAKKAKLETMELDSIVVNLADKDTAHYLRLTIVLAYTGNEKYAKELEEHKFVLRDGVIRLLRQKTNADVSAPDGAEKLKRELIREINNHLNGKEISDIYLSEYLVQ